MRRLLIKNKADSVVSVSLVEQHPYLMKYIDKNGMLKDFFKEKYNRDRRQNFPEVFILNGAIYCAKYDVLIKNKD